MAGLKLQAVTKSWDGKTQVIQPLTLDVADGEFIVMVGPSGCGKSTLLRMVAGLERVTSGDIWIDRQRVTEMEPKDRGIAMVFQNYALYPHMSVEENMAWGLLIIQDVSLGTAVAGIKGMIATGEGTTLWNQVMAAMLLTLIPPVVIVLAMQRAFVRGLVDSEK